MAEPNPIPPNLTAQAIVNFWNKVERRDPSECWPWKAARFFGGYGQHKVGGRTVRAHRLAYFIFYGIYPSQLVLHKCDNPPCCNPLHLQAGTAKENLADCKAKNRLNTAAGIRHGSFTYPESRARGERQGMSKLTEKAVKEIRRLYAAGSVTHAQLGRQFGVSREAIGTITRGESWFHVAKEDQQVSINYPTGRAIKGEANHFAKLSEDQVREIRTWHATGDITQSELAHLFHICSQSIHNIINRKSWKHI